LESPCPQVLGKSRWNEEIPAKYARHVKKRTNRRKKRFPVERQKCEKTVANQKKRREVPEKTVGHPSRKKGIFKKKEEKIFPGR